MMFFSFFCRSPAELNGKADNCAHWQIVNVTWNPRCQMEWYASALKLPACNMTKRSANFGMKLRWPEKKPNRVRGKVDPSLRKGKCRIHTWSRSGLLPRAAPRQRALPALSAAAADCAAAMQSSRGLHCQLLNPSIPKAEGYEIDSPEFFRNIKVWHFVEV